MASMLPTTNSCCECGSPLNVTTFEAFLAKIDLEDLGLVYVPTLAALRAVETTSAFRLAITEGLVTEGDGIYGFWDWKLGNTDADDGGLTTARPDDYGTVSVSIRGTWKRRN